VTSCATPSGAVLAADSTSTPKAATSTAIGQEPRASHPSCPQFKTCCWAGGHSPAVMASGLEIPALLLAQVVILAVISLGRTAPNWTALN
jgi:hypothetical protein